MKDKKELSPLEKKAITLNIIIIALVCVSGIVRILVNTNVLEALKNSLAYTIIDIIVIFIAVVLVTWACVIERKIKKQSEQNNK